MYRKYNLLKDVLKQFQVIEHGIMNIEPVIHC